MVAWAKLLASGGWLGLTWPKEVGGRGLGMIEQLLFYHETAAYDPPQLGQMVSLGVVGPTLLRFGDEAQRRRFLPRILAVEDLWCLGFSEPNSGSDLASLRTTAVADGDDFVVSGQKIWTSHAPMADWCFVLAREPGSLKLREMRREVLLHGHCHQKAFDAMAPVQQVLAMVPGLQVRLVETSCCGMAGSFGYEAEHYDVSMKMGEMALLPAVRAAPEALVVADGTSCRHQIADGTRREAWHVARLLSEALAN